jgi:hypothetical protein
VDPRESQRLAESVRQALLLVGPPESGTGEEPADVITEEAATPT